MISDYCVYVENHIHPEVCDNIIDLFKSQFWRHERFDKSNRPRFTQFNFTKNKDVNEELHDICCRYALDAVELYSTKVKGFKEWTPVDFGFEELRIKRYIAKDKDCFDTHVEAWNSNDAKRFLNMMWYLNDVEDGGSTEFTEFELEIQPKAGSLLIFPPFWMFPHKGNLLKTGKKYLLSTYLHYLTPGA